MKLPLIKHILSFVEENDEDFVEETIATLEHISDHTSLKDEEVDTIGEIISNLYGALEVQKEINTGKQPKEALNNFMQRVRGSIDT